MSYINNMYYDAFSIIEDVVNQILIKANKELVSNIKTKAELYYDVDKLFNEIIRKIYPDDYLMILNHQSISCVLRELELTINNDDRKYKIGVIPIKVEFKKWAGDMFEITSINVSRKAYYSDIKKLTFSDLVNSQKEIIDNRYIKEYERVTSDKNLKKIKDVLDSLTKKLLNKEYAEIEQDKLSHYLCDYNHHVKNYNYYILGKPKEEVSYTQFLNYWSSIINE